MKALVVDDNAFNRDILSYILEDAGHHVIQANNGAEACHMFETQTDIEFILMDVEYAGDGWLRGHSNYSLPWPGTRRLVSFCYRLG